MSSAPVLIYGKPGGFDFLCASAATTMPCGARRRRAPLEQMQMPVVEGMKQRARESRARWIVDGGVKKHERERDHDDAHPQAITLKLSVLVCSPIKSRRLISSRMKISTTGSQMPLATCERTRIFNSGALRQQDDARRRPRSEPCRANRTPALRCSLLSRPASKPRPSQITCAVDSGRIEAANSEALSRPKANSSAGPAPRQRRSEPCAASAASEMLRHGRGRSAWRRVQTIMKKTIAMQEMLPTITSMRACLYCRGATRFSTKPACR